MTRRKQRGTWRGKVLEIAFVVIAIVAIVVFAQPFGEWFGAQFAP